MTAKPIHIGNSRLYFKHKSVHGSYVKIDNEDFYKISHYDQMPPFLMSIVSDSDHWMFISSNGALTAGRKNPDQALFPYYTDDKIQDSADLTGSRTIIITESNKKRFLWEPFSSRYENIYNIERNLYKNVYGNQLIFEEINIDLDICFSYAWLNSEKYGFIKHARLTNYNKNAININILDGIQNILPYGIEQMFQNQFSTLADAYKRNELIEEIGLGLYSLSSIPIDRAEPSEALKVSTVWSVGVKSETILVSSGQLNNFRKALPLTQEKDIRAVRGAYFINSSFDIQPGAEKSWYIVSEINQDSRQVKAICRMLHEDKNIIQKIEDDVAKGTANLKRIVANSDGFQTTGDKLTTSRHFSNVLFNIMRGGIFDSNYQIDKSDFMQFIADSNKLVFKRQNDFLRELPDKIDYNCLITKSADLNDQDFEKLCYEYLPLTFSRRHGDPSRPWNRFSIDIKDVNGNKNLNYQGNWRDIFQNWEGLALSFPQYIQSFIVKFVNASTCDGYNPYRITRDGFDWETMDPADPWSYIGYWGDHQIIYLLKLLELSEKYFPGRLHQLLTKEIFAYANVPYRIKSYKAMMANPHSTVNYDQDLESAIKIKVSEIGSDGKFILDKSGNIYHVNLAEKLLMPILSKLLNFIPEAGIWMNTQRPEWNDANNALVGYGVSMVTLYYLGRHLVFCKELFSDFMEESISMSEEVADLFMNISTVFAEHQHLLNASFSDTDRKIVLDSLGLAGERYRNNIYANSFSERKKTVAVNEIVDFFICSLAYLEHSIQANKRDDGLYHSYNLMCNVTEKSISIRHLYEMLEGQVAVLSSGFLSIQEVLHVLKALRKSSLYREDQNSYILYPDRHLKRFMDKNIISAEDFESSKLLKHLVAIGNRNVVTQDIDGIIHFNGAFRNAMDLRKALEEIQLHDPHLSVEGEIDNVLGIFEKIFDHRSFTGRSGTFYKFEGLGCIYWHMVSKLLLAVNENYYRTIFTSQENEYLSELYHYYYEIKDGIGVNKPPHVYGGFPTDPYSHTPSHIGVQQPGMTGQVKEDIISRFGELGVRIHEGKISFIPELLRAGEFLNEEEQFSFYDVDGNRAAIPLEKGTFGFTICQVPIVYHICTDNKMKITGINKEIETVNDLTLDSDLSASVFNREGDIRQIDVFVNRKTIRAGNP